MYETMIFMDWVLMVSVGILVVIKKRGVFLMAYHDAQIYPAYYSEPVLSDGRRNAVCNYFAEKRDQKE